MKKLYLIFALLFFTNSNFAQDSLYQNILRMIDSVSMENITAHIQNLEYAGGHFSRVNFTPGCDSGGMYIYNYLTSLPGANVRVDTFYIPSAQSPFNQKPLFNYEITFQGAVDDYYIIGAHYDASASRMGAAIWNNQWQTIKAPGADDNASGVASVLEMARILSDSSFSFNRHYTLKLVAFGAEELGPAYSGNHHGSKHYAAQASIRGDVIEGMISLDMIGYNNFNLYNAIVADLASRTFGEKVLYANDLFEIDLLLNQSPFAYGVYSDHQSFWDEGYRAILIIENAPPWNNGPYYSANPYYHTSSDTIGTLNLELVTKVAKLNLALLSALSGRLTVTGLNEETAAVSNYKLMQNYPNPFNPVTKIKFTIADFGYINLKVYDILGNEIATLVNEEKQPGEYEVEFNASGLSSGVYYYHLSAGSSVQTNKMILLR